MGDNPQADLTLIARQQRRLLSDMDAMRDDLAVLVTIVQRFDLTVSGLVNEIRATHTQLSHLDRRVRYLEAHQP